MQQIADNPAPQMGELDLRLRCAMNEDGYGQLSVQIYLIKYVSFVMNCLRA
jgi:hypothetical protein